MTSSYHLALRANIWKLYLLKTLMGMFLVIPIIVLFFQDNGLTLQEVFILQGAFTLSLVIWELPSGYLSDRWGRKNTCTLAGFCYFLAVLIYSMSNGFWGFLVGELILGIGVSFFSGTLEALTYDTLLELKEEKTYRKVHGHQAFLHFGAEALGSVIGGALATYSLRAPMLATLVPFAGTFLVSLTLEEPKRHTMSDTAHLQAMLRICKQTFASAPLRSVIILHACISTLTMIFFWFTQPFQMDTGLPLAYFGLAHAVIVAAGAIASKCTHTMERWIDDRLFLMLIALIVLVGYFAVGSMYTIYGLIFFLTTRVCWGFLSPLSSDLINRMTSSDIRATVLSVKGFAFRLLFTIISPLIGAAADVYTVQQAMIMVGITGVIVIGIVLILMRGVWHHIPK